GRFRGGRRFVGFRGGACGELAGGREPVALLLDASGFANAIGEEADQARGQFRHFLDQFGELGRREYQDAPAGEHSKADAVTFHAGEGQKPGDVTGVRRIYGDVAGVLAAPLELAVEDYEHRVRDVTLADVGIALGEAKFLRIGEEPVELVVG